MILQENIEISVNVNNIKHLFSLGYENLKMREKIIIPVHHLSINSHYKIHVKCDVCGKEKLLRYSRYMKSFNNGGYYACSVKCNSTKGYCLFGTEEMKAKIKLSTFKKYGVEHNSQSNMIKEKKKQTSLKNYGVEYPAQSEIVKNKIKKTMLEKYGVENPSQADCVKEKKKETCLKNHGVDSPLQDSKIFYKNKESGLKIKKYKNTDLYYQGSYEKDFLDKYYDKIEIESGLRIEYIFNNNKKYYHSDYYISDYNLIVEIKSTYWYENDKDKNIIKEEYAKKLHNYIMILNKNYDAFEKLING